MYSLPRSSSPFFEERLSDDVMKKFHLGTGSKVHRIRCKCSFSAEVVRVVSPNQIWVRSLNHIEEKLRCPINQAPPDEKCLEEGRYVMTPVDEEFLGRARIVGRKDEDFVVRFIDHGHLAYRKAEHMFQMKRKELKCHPWQAIQVSLFGVYPASGNCWSIAECNALRSILEDYNFVWVKPSPTEYFCFNDDSEPMRATLQGINAVDLEVAGRARNCDNVGEDIGDLYKLQFDSYLSRAQAPVDAYMYPNFPTAFEDEIAGANAVFWFPFKRDDTIRPPPRKEGDPDLSALRRALGIRADSDTEC